MRSSSERSRESSRIVFLLLEDTLDRRRLDVETLFTPLVHRDVTDYTVPLHLANDDNFDDLEVTTVREENSLLREEERLDIHRFWRTLT